ncbi:MAG: hypothetical protein HC927_05485, partial [Deltaproteobacteria bacterium]|nr:hypothetical protein [Deltaproteobacteria bacterium]
MVLTRKQFLLGGLAAATTTALLDACTSDDEGGRDTFSELDDDVGTS